MGVTKLTATPDIKKAKAAHKRGEIGVLLYQHHQDEIGGLGSQLITATTRILPSRPSKNAWDFLSIALSVYAADRFVLRSAAEDGWTRQISITIDVVQPNIWKRHAKALNNALQFLTGDIWDLNFNEDGVAAPIFTSKFAFHDSVCLFSGGLDSLIGATNLIEEGAKPLLVSHGSRLETTVQSYLAEVLGIAESDRLDCRAAERHKQPYEPSMRARSLLFLAFGAIACSSIATKQNPRIPLIIPENGLIAINPPLTKRRIGTLSTRTTHSHFLSSLQAIFDEVGIGAILRNPYRGKTKGEMISACVSKKALRYMHRSYSCGKGKRLNMQCGQCVPCLIRRAAFHAASVTDKSTYYYNDLSMQGKADDVFSMRLATAKKYNRAEIERWAAASGPLPSDKDERKLHIEVVQRGILEVKQFLDTIKWH